MNQAERFAEEYFTRHSLRPERFKRQEIRRGKTPDYRVFKGTQLVAYCEAKHIQRDDWAGGLRSDPVFNRISNHIHEAAQQFRAVNPVHEYPNILVFANSDRMCDTKDLDSVITGLFRVAGGKDEAIYSQYSEGRIKAEKHSVDLYIWWDTRNTPDKFTRFFAKESPHRETLKLILPRSERP